MFAVGGAAPFRLGDSVSWSLSKSCQSDCAPRLAVVNTHSCIECQRAGCVQDLLCGKWLITSVGHFLGLFDLVNSDSKGVDGSHGCIMGIS
jgi:hypothetical protein